MWIKKAVHGTDDGAGQQVSLTICFSLMSRKWYWKMKENIRYSTIYIYIYIECVCVCLSVYVNERARQYIFFEIL